MIDHSLFYLYTEKLLIYFAAADYNFTNLPIHFFCPDSTAMR
jgi:hypothetical protein